MKTSEYSSKNKNNIHVEIINRYVLKMLSREIMVLIYLTQTKIAKQKQGNLLFWVSNTPSESKNNMLDKQRVDLFCWVIVNHKRSLNDIVLIVVIFVIFMSRSRLSYRKKKRRHKDKRTNDERFDKDIVFNSTAS